MGFPFLARGPDVVVADEPDCLAGLPARGRSHVRENDRTPGARPRIISTYW